MRSTWRLKNNMQEETHTDSVALRVLLHAPTASAVLRARNNAFNLLKSAPDSEVRIVVNADGVASMLDDPHPEADVFALVCENTLKRLGRQAPPSLLTIPNAILAIAKMQQDGWLYIR